jgi:hypothetical protein
MKLVLLYFLLVAFNSLKANHDTLPWIEKDFKKYKLFVTKNDSIQAGDMTSMIETGRNQVSHFFKKNYPNFFSVYVFPGRDLLNKQWQNDWNMPGFRSECWMVASGIATRLDLLSPLAWGTEACDHNGKDKLEVQQIITHELVHVFHAQKNPKPDFEGMDDLSWLVEGLAVLASGQLSPEKIEAVKKQISSGNAPVKLVDFWKGALRYQQAGSLVRFIQQKYGQKKLVSLLPLTTPGEVLKSLSISETDLIQEWKAFYQ